MWRPGGNIMEINGFLELSMHTQCHMYRKVSAVFSLVNTLEAWKKWWKLSPQGHYIWLNLSFLHNSLYSIIHHYPQESKGQVWEKKKKKQKTEERRTELEVQEEERVLFEPLSIMDNSQDHGWSFKLWQNHFKFFFLLNGAEHCNSEKEGQIVPGLKTELPKNYLILP